MLSRHFSQMFLLVFASSLGYAQIAAAQNFWRDGPHNPYRLLSNPADIALPQYGRVQQFSSAVAEENGRDFNNYLGEEGKKKILADMEGPGAITRMWFTGSGAIAACIVSVEVDGETVVESSLGGLVSGATYPFVSPLVGRGSGGGLFSYVPIPFRRRCRVLFELKDSPAHGHYYQIQWVRYPSERGVNSFRLPLHREDEFAIDRAVWNWTTAPSRNAATDSEIRSTSGTTLLIERPGSGILRQWEIEYDPSREADLQTAKVRAIDSSETLFECPLGPLCGKFEGVSEATTAYTRCEPGLLRFFWPIVHYGPLKIELTGSADLIGAVAFEHEPLGPDRARESGRLRVSHAVHSILQQATVELLRHSGKGHLAGVSMRVRGDTPSPNFAYSYLEGDDITVIDGEEGASIRGTGFEDYFNGAYYFHEGILNFPNHGVAEFSENGNISGETALSIYRFLIADSIPFERSLDLSWEVISLWREWPIEFETVLYYYDTSLCPEPANWPANLGWDLNRDGRVDTRDFLLSLQSLGGESPQEKTTVPWMFEFVREWKP